MIIIRIIIILNIIVDGQWSLRRINEGMGGEGRLNLGPHMGFPSGSGYPRLGVLPRNLLGGLYPGELLRIGPLEQA